MPELRFLTTNDAIEKIKKGEKDFSRCKIIGADFSGMDLGSVNFESSELLWIRFANCKLIKTNFKDAYIDFSYFSYSDLTQAVFEKAKVYNSGFLNVTFDKTSFKNADIRHVLFSKTNLGAVDFSGASKIRLLTSFTELNQEDFNFLMTSLSQVNLPPSFRTFTLSLLDNIKTITDKKLLKLYDIGRKFAIASMKDGYSQVSETGAAYSQSASRTYADKTVYGKQKGKKRDKNSYSL